ncbi:hypothetical protein BDQ17DRAFT_1340953 [Cyathus striatus]|nr:hypothetical protein BDQ17DRAFT_1340953 [Cyathus striatus]
MQVGRSGLYRMGKSPSPTCYRCHRNPETTDHFLFHCPPHAIARSQLARTCSLSRHRLTLEAPRLAEMHSGYLRIYPNHPTLQLYVRSPPRVDPPDK